MQALLSVPSVIAAHAGCFIAPLTFQLFWHSFPIGDPNSEYKAPFANVYRGMAVIGTQVTTAPLIWTCTPALAKAFHSAFRKSVSMLLYTPFGLTECLLAHCCSAVSHCTAQERGV